MYSLVLVNKLLYVMVVRTVRAAVVLLGLPEVLEFPVGVCSTLRNKELAASLAGGTMPEKCSRDL